MNHYVLDEETEREREREREREGDGLYMYLDYPRVGVRSLTLEVTQGAITLPLGTTSRMLSSCPPRFAGAAHMRSLLPPCLSAGQDLRILGFFCRVSTRSEVNSL